MAIFAPELKKKKKSKDIDRRGLYVFIIIIFIMIYLGFIFSRNLYDNFRIKKKIAKLEERINLLEEENRYLKDLLVYYNTDSYKEKEARARLSLKKKGETVVAVPKDVSSSAKEDDDLSPQKKRNVSNWRKWWEFFFSSG